MKNEVFWKQEANKIPWFKDWDQLLEWKKPFAKWFIGGELNASYVCLDQHINSWRKNKVAFYWENEEGETVALTYLQLYQKVNRFASALKNIGVKKGDKIIIFMPMRTA